MKIDINGVSITLTEEQLAEIARQTQKVKSFKDIKSFEIACEHLGITISSFNEKLKGLDKSEIAFRKLKIIVKAIRSFTNWKPNWSNSNQRKYRIWFDLEKGFWYWNSDYYDTSTSVPSALLLKSSDLAYYCGVKFTPLYKDYYQ